MPLPSGVRLGPYEVVGLIGAGGMGEVYRARDVRLDRTVALKVLPESFASQPALRARFEREARAISALTHPHICTLHDVGEQDGRAFLVMEHLEGETLAERLQKGPLPLPSALAMASQIADALSVAHRQGIVHRDLKPGNVMLTRQGVKLLDFGLARFVEPADRRALGGQATLTTKPTVLTGFGVIMGTAPYMAPEQLEGKPADGRTDLWALGTIIYEMVSGRRAFEGQSQASLIGAILERQPPPLSSFEPLTPPSLERLVRRCLAKSPDDRWDSAHDVADELNRIAESGPEPAATPPRAPAGSRRRLVAGMLALAVAVAAMLGALAGWRLLAPRRPQALVVRSLLDISPAEELDGGGAVSSATPAGARTAFAWTPDGKSLVFAGRSGEVQRLYVRALGGDEARPLAGTEGGLLPAVSPDGQMVAFWADQTIRTVPLGGGPVGAVATDVILPRGLAWGEDETIIWGDVHDVIMAAPAERAPAALTRKLDDERAHILPHVLPGGRVLLYTVRRHDYPWGDDDLVAQDLKTGERKLLLKDAVDARYAASGHLVFMRRGTLMAVPFDLERVESRGTPVPVLAGVAQSLTSGTSNLQMGSGQYAVAPTGALAFVRGAIAPYPNAQLVEIDRFGRIRTLDAPARSYAAGVALSPDGRRMVVVIRSLLESACWVYDLARGTLTKLTSGGECMWPLWTPDGERISYRWIEKGRTQLAWQRADGSAGTEVLQANNAGTGSSWAPDGKQLVLTRGFDLWLATIEAGTATERSLLRTPGIDWSAQFSPDGRWLAYQSNYSGRDEVYVQLYPGPGSRVQVSLEGGTNPAWSATGRELFFLAGPRQMQVVDVPVSPLSAFSKPRLLFDLAGDAPALRSNPNRVYAVAPDGQHFYAVQHLPTPPAAPVKHIELIQNWTEELKDRVPADGRR